MEQRLGTPQATGKSALVADFGGTNIRVAILPPGGGDLTAIQRFGWDAARGHDGAARVLASVAAAADGLDGVAISVAGPVTDGIGRLTNQDCILDAASLSTQLGAPVRLMNDMTALGLSLGALTPDGVADIIPAGAAGIGNRQALVVNAGTGFNVCPVICDGIGGGATMESEAGHAALPAPVADALARAVPGAQGFATLEHLFAGPGLARLHQARGGAAGFADAVRAENTDALNTLDLAAELFGMACADLAVRHWTGDGLWLAGSAALAMGQRSAAFTRGFAMGGPMAARLNGIPVRAITDDHAPLRGCAWLLRGDAARSI